MTHTEKESKMKDARVLPTADSYDPDAKDRMFSVLSYFIVLIVIGIPVWWYTTRVYRASLPIDDMFNLEVSSTSINKHSSVPLSLEYDILITIVNPDPQNLEVQLQGEEIERHLQPFLSTLSDIAKFVVKSQWLYLVELGAVPRRMEDKFVLLEEQLPHVITPLEKKIFSHLSPRPSFNLVLYIPHCRAPLYIYDRAYQQVESNIFISPRWGGIYILNADKKSCEEGVFQPNVQAVTSTFITQLKRLFSLKSTSGRDLEELKRRQVNGLLDSSKRTLKSLAQLLSEISSIVISDDVARKIHVAVDNVNLAEESIKRGDIDGGLEYAKVAYNHSESAFSDPSLLALLYFPDDQKYAVYIPLFLPVMIPVLMSLMTVRKWYHNIKLKTE